MEISKAQEVDSVFSEVISALFGDAVDHREMFDIAKMNDSSELHVPVAVARKRKRQAQVGLASNALGITAGAAALGSAINDPVIRSKVGDEIKTVKRVSRRTKLLAGGMLGLQALNLGGDVVANRVLARESKKKISKNYVEAIEEIINARRAGQINTNSAIEMAVELADSIEKSYKNRALAAEAALKHGAVAHRTALRAAAGGGAILGGVTGYKVGKKRTLKKLNNQNIKIPVVKSDTSEDSNKVDYAFNGTISKLDQDKRLAFGWASLTEVEGKPVLDLQGDYAPIDEIEKSAYAYVIKSRVGGDMHARDGEGPKHTSDLVESFIATPEKLQQMGIAESVAKSVPVGWWVGFKINDDEQWAMVKDGRRSGFSVHGKGSRVQKALEN